MFEYKGDILTGFKEIASISKKGYSVNDVFFESPFKGRVPAYLIVPDIACSHPAIIYLHPGQGSRDSFLKEAELLAAKGFVSLLINAPFIRKEKTQEIHEKQNLARTIEVLADIEKYIQTIMDLRRGIDLLCDLECVDENQIAFVGHSFGGTWGGVLAGIEHRIRTYILIAGYPKASEWHLTSEHPMAAIIRSFLTPERFEYFIANLEKLDAIHYVKNATPSSIYFQFAKNDEYINQDQSTSYFSAASSPKKISWYDTDHLFTNCESAFQDRLEWLNEHIVSEIAKIS
ncbi:alpha/beta hydrolase family protein [Neobacillus ginsengisoli]|uniref:Cephalosporin-C deacetylase-like acetyl esterase n=1 Tax=Neobacillus ginsengisoli TaxID=904295 RepID=A0ABT9XQJ6_9BACI|nr:acetylxylan esterase [Neobacillus ginsengisoli]MDQ0197826.1 cephalosporin-C deacetylase-like acetyl esterase [Neobacillus ginsengisoli]